MLVAVALGALLLWKGGVVGFDSDGEGVDIGAGKDKGDGGAEVTTTTEAPTTTMAPASVKVVAANGAGISGLAGRTTDFVATQGYTNSVATDATASATATTVYYAEGLEPNAAALASSLGLPESAVQPLPPGAALAGDQPADAGLIIVLGPDAVAALDSAEGTGDADGGSSTTATTGGSATKATTTTSSTTTTAAD